MPQPWFDPNTFAWIPGTVLGCAGGLWGGIAGVCAPKGKAKPVVLGLSFVLLGVGVLLLIAAAVAFFSGQPYGVWYGLGLPGLILPVVLGANLPNVLRTYRAAE